MNLKQKLFYTQFKIIFQYVYFLYQTVMMTDEQFRPPFFRTHEVSIF